MARMLPRDVVEPTLDGGDHLAFVELSDGGGEIGQAAAEIAKHTLVAEALVEPFGKTVETGGDDADLFARRQCGDQAPNFGEALHEVANNARVVDGGPDVVEPRHQRVERTFQRSSGTHLDQPFDLCSKIGHFGGKAFVERRRHSPTVGTHFLAERANAGAEFGDIGLVMAARPSWGEGVALA